MAGTHFKGVVYSELGFSGPGSVPNGGTTGQVLKKSSNADQAVVWGTVAGGGGTIGLDDGTALNPSIYFNSEPGADTGFFFNGTAGVWAFASQGNQTMTFGAGGDLAITGNFSASNFPQTGTTNSAAYYNSLGNLDTWTELQRSTTTKGLNLSVTQQPNNLGSNQVNTWNVFFDPLQNSPNDNWLIHNIYVQLDQNSSGLTQGTNGSAVTLINGGYSHQGTGSTGSLNYISMNSTLGNGIDPVTIKGMSFVSLSSGWSAYTTVDGGLYGYSVQHVVDVDAISTPNLSITDFSTYSDINVAVHGYVGYNQAGHVAEIANNTNFTSINLNPTIDLFTGNAGFNGLAVSGTYGGFTTGGWQGISINPSVLGSSAAYAKGLFIDMSSTTVYAGTVSTLVIQDLTLTFNTVGDNNNITIEYVNDGTAGSETANFSNPAITVHIQSGVSTATQVKAALDANFTISSTLTTTISGVGSNTQATQGATNFTSGTNPGQKYAIDVVGNVNINGALAFTGGLNIGSLNAFFSESLTNGGGQPDSGHLLVTSPTAAASATIANADYLGVNTASLINIGANATITTAFLGVAALGLPAVATIGAGATIDRVSGAVFALSLGGGTGTIDQVSLCRSIAIPDGTTTVNRLYGYEAIMPFGTVGTDAWDIYASNDVNNWFKGSVRVGGTTITDDKADTGFKLHILGDSKLEGAVAHLTGNIGFYGTTPVTQQTSSGAQTAGAVYTATEQTMLQEVYDAIRAYGLMT